MNARSVTVLEIAATDSTFTFDDSGDWQGKCLHCGTKLWICADGTTDATIEHIVPCASGNTDVNDLRNLALACSGCNNEKGIRHDRWFGKGGRADEVVAALIEKRRQRWQEP